MERLSHQMKKVSLHVPHFRRQIITTEEIMSMFLHFRQHGTLSKLVLNDLNKGLLAPLIVSSFVWFSYFTHLIHTLASYYGREKKCWCHALNIQYVKLINRNASLFFFCKYLLWLLDSFISFENMPRNIHCWSSRLIRLIVGSHDLI